MKKSKSKYGSSIIFVWQSETGDLQNNGILGGRLGVLRPKNGDPIIKEVCQGGMAIPILSPLLELPLPKLEPSYRSRPDLACTLVDCNWNLLRIFHSTLEEPYYACCALWDLSLCSMIHSILGLSNVLLCVTESTAGSTQLASQQAALYSKHILSTTLKESIHKATRHYGLPNFYSEQAFLTRIHEQSWLKRFSL